MSNKTNHLERLINEKNEYIKSLPPGSLAIYTPLYGYLQENADMLLELIRAAESRASLLSRLDGEISFREYEAINDEICRHEVLMQKAIDALPGESHEQD